MDLRTLADWTLRLRLLAVPGVAKVAVFGSDVRSMQVQVHPDQLLRYSLSLRGRARGGAQGHRDHRRRLHRDRQPAHRLPVRGPVDRSRRHRAHGGGQLERLERAAQGRRRRPQRARAADRRRGRSWASPAWCCSSPASSAPTPSTSPTASRRRSPTCSPSIEKEGVEMRADLFRPADFIAISTQQRAAVAAARRRARRRRAVPVPVRPAHGDDLVRRHPAVAAGGRRRAQRARRDAQRHDARRPRHRHRRGGGRRRHRRREHRPAPAREPAQRATRCRSASVIIDASLEVRGAVVYATFAVILVFLPVVMLPGLAGRFFAPLGLAYVLAILASLAVAMTVTPALCMLLFPKAPRPAAHRARAVDDPPVTRWLRGHYEAMLHEDHRASAHHDRRRHRLHARRAARRCRSSAPASCPS